MKKKTAITFLALTLGAGGLALSAGQEHQHHHPMHKGAMAEASGDRDTRESVAFPEPLRSHTLQNMRDHLLVIGRIQDALGQGKFDEASELAETRLGMSSLSLHGAHDVAPHMPPGMRDAGTAMHRSASQLAVAIKDASVTGDLKATLGALARVNQTCVACHAGYKLK